MEHHSQYLNFCLCRLANNDFQITERKLTRQQLLVVHIYLTFLNTGITDEIFKQFGNRIRSSRYLKVKLICMKLSGRQFQPDLKSHKKIHQTTLPYQIQWLHLKIIKWTKYSWFYFVQSTISNSPKVTRVLACFRNPFVTNISLFELHFRHRRFILFVQMREVICFSTRSRG